MIDCQRNIIKFILIMGKSRIYTRTGDGGYTSLAGGKRVLKTDPRIEAYGTVDELNAFVANLIDEIDDQEDRELLIRIQSNLFTVGGYLATENESNNCRISPDEIVVLENEMDKIDDLLPPLKHFILPGGCKSNSLAHICRTVCRRAERCIYQINEQEEINSVVLKYINRLSDFFFLFARKQNFIYSVEEIIWENPCN
jgi:cob(I)alamin adenosyltransferase